MLLDFIKETIKPVADLIDNVHTSEEERQTLRNELAKIEAEVGLKLLDYEKQLMEARASVINSEAQGQSWLQRNWRPIAMVVFLLLVVFNSFGLLVTPLADEAWQLLQIGLGGYVIGRSTEKAVQTFKG